MAKSLKALDSDPVVSSLAPVTAISKKTVLVTSPDPRPRARAREQLEAEGFDVVEAESDEKAWEMYQGGGIDRVVVAERFVTLH